MDFNIQDPSQQVQVPMRPPDQMEQAQTTMPLPRPAQTQAPEGRGPQPANPQSNQDPSVQSIATRPQPKGLFDRVLEAAAGGPTQVQDPNTGEVRELPMTKKGLAAHILAGAITGIIQGAAESSKAPVGPAGTRGPQNMAALAGGFQGTSDKLNEIRNAPQAQLDQQMLRRAAAIKNTTDELRNQMMADKLHEDDWSRKEDFYTKTRDVWQPIVDNIEAADKDRATGAPSLFFARGLTGQEAMDKLKGQTGNMSPIQDGWTTETHSDGRTYHVPTFALVSNGSVPVTREALIALAPFNSGVKELLDKGMTGDSVQLPATMLISFEKSAQAAHGAYEFIRQIQDGLGVESEKQLSQAAFNDKFRSTPALQRQVSDLATTLGNVGTQSTAHALAQLQASGKAAEIFKLIGVSPDKVQDFLDDKQNEAIAEAAKAKAAGQVDVKQAAADAKQAEMAAKYSPEAIAGEAKLAGAKAGAEARAKAAVTSSSLKNDDGSWNVSSIPVKLVEGTMDPSQLSKRSQDYNLKIQQADEYSMAKYGKPFDIAKAASDYTFAKNPQTQNTLKYLNSLTGADNKSGNLGALVAQSNRITRTDFPALNDAAAWARLKTGDPAMAAYFTAVTEVADQVAKILQGGGSGNGTSDAKLKQAAELFDKGFSKGQIVAVADTLRSLLANRKSELIGDNRYLQKQYGATATPSTQPIYARNPQTGQRVVSNDNGRTWTAVQ